MSTPSPENPHFTPLAINLAGLPCLVVGGGRVGVRQDQADEFPVVGTHATKDVGIFPHPVRRHFRATTERGPAAHRIAHPTETGFILKHQAQGPVRVSSRHGVHCGLKFF